MIKIFFFLKINFAKLDSLFRLKDLDKYYKISKIIMKNNTIISLNVNYNKNSIKDSYWIKNNELDKLCKSFEVETKKIEFDYNKINKDNLYKKESLIYLEKDLISLYQVLNKFYEYVFNKTSLNISNYKTISSLAYNVYFSNYYKKEYDIKIIDNKIEKDIRQSYYGGLVDVYKPYVKEGYYYDINSQYPYQMLKYDMPVGNPIYSSDNKF